MTAKPASTELALSRIGLGCNNFGKFTDEYRSAELVIAALDSGITFFDTADVYGDTDSETFLGKALRGRRDEAFIATKFGVRFGRSPGGARPEEVRNACDASLARLGTDRIDLFQLHYPAPPFLPEAVPIADTLGALSELVDEGKVRHLGCSNFSAAELAEAADVAGSGNLHPFRAVQNEYSLLHRSPEREVLPKCRELGVDFVPYYPLASGLLTGKYSRGAAPEADTRLASGWTNWSQQATNDTFDLIDSLSQFALSSGRTLVELAVGFLLSQPGVPSVVIGATKVAQVRSNAAAADWVLTPEEISVVQEITRASLDAPLRSAEIATAHG